MNVTPPSILQASKDLERLDHSRDAGELLKGVSITREDFNLRHFSGDCMEQCPRAPVQFSDLTMRQFSHGEDCKASPKFSVLAPRSPSHHSIRLIKCPRQCEAGVSGQVNLQSGLLLRAGPFPQTGPGKT